MTTLTDRLRKVLQGRTADPIPAPSRLKVKGGSSLNLWPNYRNERPLWSMNDLQSFIDHGFNINAIIYAACMYRADAVNSAQLRAYRGDQDKADPLEKTEPLAALLARPNPFQSAHEFHALNSVFFGLAGQSYVWFVRPAPKATPTAMYTLRPDWVKIVPSRGKGQAVIGYVYQPDGTAIQDGYPLLPEDVMHVKRPNPGDPLMGAGYGLSPLGAAAQSANVDNDVTKFLKVFFQSGAMFQNAISFEDAHQPEELAAVREKLKEIYGGVDKWNEWGVFDSNAKITRVSPTFDEMGFDAIDSRNEARILMALGVPPILVGSRFGLERSTFSNNEEARRSFWEDRLLPELRMFESEFQNYLNDGDTFVKYDLSDVPALRRDVPALAVAAKTLYDMGVPARVAFTTVGLEVPQYEGENDTKPAPVANPLLGAPAVGALPKPKVEEVEGTASKARKVYDAAEMGRKVDRLATAWEQRFGDKAVSLFRQEQREISALLTELQQDAYHRKGTPRWRELIGTVLEWYEKTQPTAWRTAFIPLIEGVMVDAGKEWSTALGIAWDVRNLRGEEWFQTYTLRFAQPITQTSSDSVHAVLEQALAEGWSIPDTDKRLGQVFEQWMTGALDNGDFGWFEQRLPPYRREMISRTETIRASNAGALNLGKEWGAQRKFWIGTDDDRTRDSHIEAMTAYSEQAAILMDEPFIVNGSPMDAPGDPAAPVEEVANCRCTLGLLMD